MQVAFRQSLLFLRHYHYFQRAIGMSTRGLSPPMVLKNNVLAKVPMNRRDRRVSTTQLNERAKLALICPRYESSLQPALPIGQGVLCAALACLSGGSKTNLLVILLSALLAYSYTTCIVSHFQQASFNRAEKSREYFKGWSYSSFERPFEHPTSTTRT
jgi:hypothetical protein